MSGAAKRLLVLLIERAQKALGNAAETLRHDRDSIYAEKVDQTITAMGLTILKTPVRAPQANAFCERVIGTIDASAWTG